MPRRPRNSNTNGSLNQKIDALNGSINDLVDVLERLSARTQGSGGGNGYNNPFIRPGSRRGYSSNRDREREFYYEWSQYYKAPKRNKKWADMSHDERQKYNEEKNKRKDEAQKYVRRGQQREELYRELRGSRFGQTAVGRYTQNLMERNQKIEDYGMMGKYMQANASKIGKGLFGSGKAGAAATKAVGVFGKALGGTSKLLGGPLVTAIMMAIDGLKKLGEAMNEWKKGTADMYEHQTKQEQLQYEKEKQFMLIENQMKIENVSAQGDIQLKTLETQSATMLEALKMTSAQYAKSIETAIGPLTKGINQTAYDAMRASVQFGAEQQKLLRYKTQRETEQKRYEDLRTLQQQGKLAGFEAEKGVAGTQYTIDSRQAALDFQQKFASEHWFQNIIRNPNNNQLQTGEGGFKGDSNVGNINVVTGEKFNTITNTEQAGIGNIDNPNAWGDLLEKIIGFQQGQQAKRQGELHNQSEMLREAADYNKASVDMQYQLATTEKDYSVQIANKQLEVATEAADIATDTALEIKNMFIDLAQKTEQWIEKFDRTTNDLSKNLGYTNTRQLREFQNTMFENAKIAAKFGKTTEELAKVQQSYIENTGRNRLMGTHDTGQLMALGNYLGDDGLAANYVSEMEIFNSGVADSVDMLDETLQDVNRIGLNGRKYTKTLVDNLKLAQKYNFRGGTQGLMRMAKWAENTRFNLSSLSSMIDKIHEGGLEGVITQGAQFQVLGGHAAMNADPLAMMYEAYADPEAYAKRMQDMTKGFGQIDKATGETKFSGNEVMMMEQIAKAQGRSLEEVQNEVRARNKKEVVTKQLRGDFNEEQQALISNSATYDKATGQFKVKVKRGNEYVDTDVSQLTQEDIDKLMPEKHNERMEDYMVTVIDLLGKAFGEEEIERIEVGQGTYENTIRNQEERIAQAMANFEERKAEYISSIKDIQDQTTSTFTNFLEMASRGNQAIDDQAQQISATAANINTALQTTADIIAAANAKIASAGGIEFNAPTATGVLTLPQLNNSSNTQTTISTASVGQQFGAEADRQRAQGNYAAENGLDRAADRTFMWGTRDAIISNNNNKPIVSQVNNVTKINDGIIGGTSLVSPNVTKINDGLVQSDPKDVAIFAKEGGVIGNFLNDLYNDVHSSNGGTIHLDTVNVSISGSLDLSSGGQSVNIINEIQNNPVLLRTLSRMLAEQVSSAMNGGRGISTLAIGSV